MPVLVLHYHELWLKGRNRNFFIQKLTDAIRLHLGGLGKLRVTHEDGRILVSLEEDQSVAPAVERLRKVFGIAYYSVAEETTRELATVARTAWTQLARQSFQTFAVRARRADKTLPFRSSDAEREVGSLLLDYATAAGRPLKVDLGNPDVTCRVEFTHHRALVYSEKIPGPGGMPANTAGKLACLLSGGYDSAVAAYLMMRRGARMIFVHFHGVAARVGEASEPVARELVQILTPYQGAARLYLVPFYELQREILLGAPEPYRILLYRRLMLRIAESIARQRHALGMVTGDCLAQVASQTLHNMNAVGAVARLPVYRPLVGYDKQDIINLARKIGTYETSSERFSDCCPAFMPRHPSLHARPEELDRAEEKLDIPDMVRRGVAAAECEIYRFGEGRTTQVRMTQVRMKEDAPLPTHLVV
jgi:thiamine biosynthesis protein ThiI